MTTDPVIDELNLPPSVSPYRTSVDTEISADDGMYFDNRQHYFSCGASALACITHALGLAAIANPDTILDFGAGAGRVTRWIRAAFPDAKVHACDIRKQDMEFLHLRFGATTWVSGVDIASLTARGTYDFIWVGSVFTHLSAGQSSSLFHKLMGWLNPNGALIFSVHGRFVLHRASTGDNIYGMGERWNAVVQGYNNSGYGYADYPGQSGYGISLSKSNWWIAQIEKRDAAKLVCLSERAWDHHHDVIAVQNTAWG